MRMWKSPKSAYLKRLLCSTLALGLAAGAAFATPLLTKAEDDKVDLTKKVAFTINSTPYTTEDEKNELATANIVLDVYKVADAVAVTKGATDGYELNATSDFTDANNKVLPDAGYEPTDKEWANVYAQAAAKIVKGNNSITPVASVDMIDNESIKVYTATVKDLEAGLYLVIPHGKNDPDYFETVGESDDQTLVTIATSLYNKYSFKPMYVTLPTKPADANGIVKTTNEGAWIYSLTGDKALTIKGNQEVAYGKLEIIKDLLEFETSEPATFVFSVEATKNGNTVYSNVVSLYFTAAGQQRALIERIPIGSEVTVKEVYSGRYVCVNGSEKTATIQANDIASVTFENKFCYKKHCGAITNVFDPVKDADGNIQYDENGNVKYNWIQIPKKDGSDDSTNGGN